MNDDKLYPVYDETYFFDFVDCSGLNPGKFMRLSTDSLSGLMDKAKCFTEGCINKEIFNTDVGGLSGDIYIALTADKAGNSALVLDNVRPDYARDEENKIIPGQYVFDQEPVVISLDDASHACKIMHANWNGRTCDKTIYDSAVSGIGYDTLYDIKNLPQEIYDSLPFASDYISKCIEK